LPNTIYLMNILNNRFSNLLEIAEKNKEKYHSADPFPNISFENFFNENFLNLVLAEFPDLSKKNDINFKNENENKLTANKQDFYGVNTLKLLNFLNSQNFLYFLQGITGIKETLISDPYFIGGGLHESKSGGYLKVHADFNKHSSTNLDRRINFLVYLNKDWEDEYNGHFELWNKDLSKCIKKIKPSFNSIAMFTTSSYSYHGLPDPIQCPPNMSRKSIALYYYTNGRPKEEVTTGLEEHGTIFRSRKNLKKDAVENHQQWKVLLKSLIPPIVYKVYENFRK
jgi:Rps23 Pro-64 3,4-dihydroxylase Tpa1-like proline 4-hydroxylase